MNRGPERSARRRRFGIPVVLLGLVIGCSPSYEGGGCGPPPRSTDASSPAVQLGSEQAPCTYGLEAVRGSDPHLLMSFQCPGESDAFLIALKVDGQLQSMKEVRGAGYGTTVTVDGGSWEPADGDWHQVEVVLDPLDLFHETDETNNRAVSRMRIVAPDAAIDDEASGFVVPWDAGGDGVTLVTQVFAGTPVDVRLRMHYGGPYPSIVRSVRSGTVMNASDTVTLPRCPDYSYLTSAFVARWTPPGPGTYVVEFRIAPQGDTPDDPATNLTTKTLTVLSSGSARTDRAEATP